MTNKIITIGRQFGSNGRIIGQQLANKLGIPFYDKELLNKTAKNSGLSEQILSSLDEKPTKSFLYSLVMDPYNYTYSGGGMQINLNQQAFQATYDTIKKIADEGPCVIVGRCADYALREYDNLVRIFIYAPLQERIKTVASKLGITEDKAKSLINNEDKGRAAYYNYYSTNKWGAIDTYDLLVNSSLMDIDKAVDFLISFINDMK
ncbi:MAG: cytidylate kinase-like family protein [Lachnospiraceae bacterium]|nr:cytidylate kinase-like family protein [Lachnospiraceae bacterium]